MRKPWSKIQILKIHFCIATVRPPYNNRIWQNENRHLCHPYIHVSSSKDIFLSSHHQMKTLKTMFGKFSRSIFSGELEFEILNSRSEIVHPCYKCSFELTKCTCCAQSSRRQLVTLIRFRSFFTSKLIKISLSESHVICEMRCSNIRYWVSKDKITSAFLRIVMFCLYRVKILPSNPIVSINFF